MTDQEGPDPIDVAVGARIRIRRQEIGMSQQMLAQHLGVTFQQVQKYERGTNRISASMLVRTARALNCSGDQLLGTGPSAGEAEQPQDDVLQAELNSLLAGPGAIELLRAFAEVPTGEARSAVIAIVKGLAPPAWSRRNSC
jgi:transcriptional regulator with XRE-family HTH domain